MNIFRQEATFSIPFHCLVMATLHSNGQAMPLFYSGELFIYYNWATVCNGRGCPLVVRYWADLQPVTGFFAMTTSPNAKCHRVLVLALGLVMAALCNMACHYIFALCFRSFMAALCNTAGHIYFHPVVSFMVALWNRKTIYIFMLWFVLLLFFLA